MSNTRIKIVMAALQEKQLDACIITKTSDIRWLTGFSRVFDEEQAHMVLLAMPQEGSESQAGSAAHDAPAKSSIELQAELRLFSDTRYSAALRERAKESSWQILDERRARFEYLMEQIKAIYSHGAEKTLPQLRIAIEGDLRLDWYRALNKAAESVKDELKVEFIEIDAMLEELRAVKDEEEIAALKAAQAITDAGFEHMLGFLKVGITEKLAASELEHFMRSLGADGLAFPSIVAFGANSAIPHAKPGDAMLKSGDFVLMDFGARVDDYCSDMTRTVVCGKASNEQRKIYDAVLAAQSAAAAALKSGLTGKEAQAVADKVIVEHGFEGKFIHSLGHGVGIDIHELPVLAGKIETKLKPGNVVTIEPGVYIEGLGGVRIEDFGVITADGFLSFTHSPHELIEI